MFDQVHEGLDVCDVADDKLGEINEIYEAHAPEGGRTGARTMRVSTGVLGLGLVEYHVPFSTIASVADERVRLNAGPRPVANSPLPREPAVPGGAAGSVDDDG